MLGGLVSIPVLLEEIVTFPAAKGIYVNVALLFVPAARLRTWGEKEPPALPSYKVRLMAAESTPTI